MHLLLCGTGRVKSLGSVVRLDQDKHAHCAQTGCTSLLSVLAKGWKAEPLLVTLRLFPQRLLLSDTDMDLNRTLW